MTPNAVQHLKLIRETMTGNTGFITGVEIGQFRIIEQLLPIAFDETTIDRVYTAAFNRYGDKLLGAFFFEREPFANDWFIETIILHIKDPEPEFFFYDADNNSLPLTYEEET